MKIWINGVMVDREEALVSAFDHGITVGDGVFETAKVVNGVPFALSRHLDRLAGSARGLGLPVPDSDLVRHAVEDTLEENDTSRPLRLRITYTGGPGPLGSDRDDVAPTLIVALAPLKRWPASSAVVTVPWTRNERAPTTGLKTTSYADNVVALSYAHERGAAEAIFGNSVGDLCEGTGSNIFLVLDGDLVTPPLSSGCLPGVTRELVIEWCGAIERELPLAALTDAAEVFLTSSTRDVHAVHSVDDRQLEVGTTTRVAAETFARRSAEDADPREGGTLAG